MTTYWLSFRIAEVNANSQNPSDRRNDLYETVRQNSTGTWWVDTTSFILVESHESIGDLATVIKNTIAPHVDLAVIRELNTQSARIIGNVSDRDIFDMMPYLIEV